MGTLGSWGAWDWGAHHVCAGVPSGEARVGLPTISGKQNLNAGCSMERGTLDDAALAGQPRLLPGRLHSIT